MAFENNTELKEHFQTGDVPTEQQFANLVESKLTHGEAAVVPFTPNVASNGFDAVDSGNGRFFSGGACFHYATVSDGILFPYKGLAVGVAGTGNGNFGYHKDIGEGPVTFDYEFTSVGGPVTFTLRVYSLTGSENIEASQNITVDGYTKGTITANLRAGTTAVRFRPFLTGNSIVGRKLYLGRLAGYTGIRGFGDVEKVPAAPANSQPVIIPVDTIANYRGYKYDEANTEFVYFGSGGHEFVDAENIFGYPGKAVKYLAAARNNHGITFPKEMIDYADGTVVFEFYSPDEIGMTARLYQLDGNSENIIRSVNLDIPADELVRVALPFSGNNFDAAISYRLRFFERAAGIDNKEYYLGRFQAMRTFYADMDAIDANNRVPFLLATSSSGDQSPGGSGAPDVSELQANITGNPRWLRGLNIATTSEQDGFRLNDQYPQDFNLVDSFDIFGYQGKAMQIAMGATTVPNFRFQLQPEKLRLNKQLVDTGAIRVRMELMSDVNKTMSVRFHKRDGANVETVGSATSVTLVANTPNVVEASLTGVDVDDLTRLEVGFFTSFQNITLTVGRMNVYGGTEAGILEFDNDKYGMFEAYRDASNWASNEAGNTVVFLGDSLTARGYASNVANILGITQITRGFGGENSSQIRKRFLEEPSLHSLSTVVYVGRNNPKTSDFDIDVIVRDIQEITDVLTHGKFIVLMPPNGDYDSERSRTGANYVNFVNLANRLQAIYGGQFFDSRSALIQRWHYGNVRLVADYVQPSVGSNVTVTLNDNSSLSVNDEIRIGGLSLADKYRVVSTSGASNAVLELLEADRIAVGDNVSRPFSDNGADNYPAYFDLYVVTEVDYQDYQDDTTPEGARADNIHLTTEADVFLAELIAPKIIASALVTKL